MRDLAAQLRDLLDEARGDELVLVVGHEEHRLDMGIEAVVHAGHLELVFEIGDGAQAAHDHRGADLHGKMHEEVVEGAHLDALARLGIDQLRDLLLHDGDAVLAGEERALADVLRHADHQPVDDLGRAQDDVGVAVGDRVERARINADARLAHADSPCCGIVPSSSIAPFSPFSPTSAATDTTRSPSSTLNTVTPPLRRRRMLMSPTGTRITMPLFVTCMSLSLSAAGNTATVINQLYLMRIDGGQAR